LTPEKAPSWRLKRWELARRVWEVRRDQALQLGLRERMEHAKVSIGRNFQVYAYRNLFLLIEVSFYL
jgi:hypothetical protein